MSVKDTLRMLVEVTPEEGLISDDKEATDWFYGLLMGENLVLLERGEMDDDIGPLKVIAVLEPQQGRYSSSMQEIQEWYEKKYGGNLLNKEISTCEKILEFIKYKESTK